ncbi:tyrosine-type recombinase/integrase [Clostridium sp. 1xD42-85]|uniref:tyrosine-type recombinase/integrase n=1 Tax=Clostridia TaxID=186801 RepID=UPI00336A4C7D
MNTEHELIKVKRVIETIKIDDILITQLKSYYLSCKKIKVSLGLHLQENDLVFIRNTGSPCNDSTLNKAFESLFDGLEIKRITPHGLRHTHATILIKNRIPVIEIAQLLREHSLNDLQCLRSFIR